MEYFDGVNKMLVKRENAKEIKNTIKVITDELDDTRDGAKGSIVEIGCDVIIR